MNMKSALQVTTDTLTEMSDAQQVEFRRQLSSEEIATLRDASEQIARQLLMVATMLGRHERASEGVESELTSQVGSQISEAQQLVHFTYSTFCDLEDSRSNKPKTGMAAAEF